MSEHREARRERPYAVIFCERIDNESFCESIVRELGAYYDVQAVGPGWQVEHLEEIDTTRARFFLELDPASGNFYRPGGLDKLEIPKFAWLIDTHKKPVFHKELAKRTDLTFYAMKSWGHVFESPASWLPPHCDTTIFHPFESPRDIDIAFVGSQEWRAEPIRELAKKHGLKVHISCTTGPREKSETAAIYARSKLVFNRHCTNDLNFRVFEAMACGRVLLTDAQQNGQYELFEDERHCFFYKDDRDLERLVLRLLKDDETRARVEREAAEHVARSHSTRARVAQLVDAIEAHLSTIALDRSPPVAQPLGENLEDAPGVRGRRRWLFFVGEEPKTVEGRSYAERLAWGLARYGHEVTIARGRRRALPVRPTRAGEPTICELELGPLPEAPNGANALLAAAGPLHALFQKIARERWPVDAIVGEGALGALVAAPLATRTLVPFVLALDDCEVAKRTNRLTREQLSIAELEHWAVERATTVVVASPNAADAVRRHYRARDVRVVTAPMLESVASSDGSRLLGALGLAGEGFELILAPPLGERERYVMLNGAQGPIVLVSDGVWLRDPSGEIRCLSRRPAAGPALAALIGGARIVRIVDERDSRLEEARALGASTEPPCDEPARGAGLERLEALGEPARAKREALHAALL